jgi:hypothetical protein
MAVSRSSASGGGAPAEHAQAEPVPAVGLLEGACLKQKAENPVGR